MKILLNPAFESLRTFVESVPHIFGEEGETIYKGRNKIKVPGIRNGPLSFLFP